MKKTIIHTENLSVSFDKNEVLRNININIKQGEIVAIIGPNGSGKSTLLKAILGLIPYQGKITIFDQPITKITDKIGYVPQKFEFDKTFPLTIREFLEISEKNVTNKEINHALNEAEMSAHQKQLIGQLSGGQLQRILIARAILKQPEILFLDEPTTGIDIEGEMDFYQMIKHQNEYHKVTVIMISHEISMVYKHASQIICLNRDLICMGKPKQAITKEVLKKLYGDDVDLMHHEH